MNLFLREDWNSFIGSENDKFIRSKGEFQLEKRWIKEECQKQEQMVNKTIHKSYIIQDSPPRVHLRRALRVQWDENQCFEINDSNVTMFRTIICIIIKSIVVNISIANISNIVSCKRWNILWKLIRMSYTQCSIERS